MPLYPQVFWNLCYFSLWYVQYSGGLFSVPSGFLGEGGVFIVCYLKKSKTDLNWLFPVIKPPKVYLAKTGVKN